MMKRPLWLAFLLLVPFLAFSREEAPVAPDSPAITPEAEAHAQLRRRVEAGDAEAMNYLGYLLLSGREGMEQDSAEGLLWLVRAASTGDAKAASNLGWLFIEGDLLEKNPEEGARWLGIAADKGLPVAQSLLGDLYRDGIGVAADSLRADSLYREAFRHGLADAGYKLYALNADSYASLSPEELVETGKYFYLGGAPSEGVKLFYLASEKGNPDALALLGDAYTRAVGVPYDYDLSLNYYARAALAGNPSAQFVIGELLEIFPDALQNVEVGAGMPSDPFYWYEKAVEAGVTDAETATKRLLEYEF